MAYWISLGSRSWRSYFSVLASFQRIRWGNTHRRTAWRCVLAKAWGSITALQPAASFCTIQRKASIKRSSLPSSTFTTSLALNSGNPIKRASPFVTVIDRATERQVAPFQLRARADAASSWWCECLARCGGTAFTPGLIWNWRWRACPSEAQLEALAPAQRLRHLGTNLAVERRRLQSQMESLACLHQRW